MNTEAIHKLGSVEREQLIYYKYYRCITRCSKQTSRCDALREQLTRWGYVTHEVINETGKLGHGKQVC